MPSPLLVVVELARAEDADDPFAFRWRALEYNRRLGDGAVRTASLRWKGDVREDIAALARAPQDVETMARIGDTLRTFLREAGWDRDEAAILDAADAGRPVHVVFRFAAAELFALPWELLAVGDGGRRLGNVAGIDIRYQWPGSSTAPVDPDPPREGGRLLFAWSDAGGPVPGADHRDRLRRAFAGSGLEQDDAPTGGGPFDPGTDELADATYTDLARQLRTARSEGRPYTMLHLLAHAGAVAPGAGSDDQRPVGLALASGVLDGATLRELLAEHAPSVRLVVVCACRGSDPNPLDNHLGSVALELHRAGVAGVLASRWPLSADGSIAVAGTLYRELLCAAPPASLERAVAETRRALRDGASPADATSLQLYAREADGLDARPAVFRPYRGLLAFGPEHRRFFFGRDAEQDEVLAKLQALIDEQRPRFLVVEGASGSGKSSLVLAAVVPVLLARGGWRWARMAPGSSPRRALADALAELIPDEDDGAAGPDDGGERQLLVVDQFEELFTQTDDKHHGRRVDLVRRLWSLATAPEGRVSVLCTMRTDFRGRCGELRLDPVEARDEAVSGRRMDTLFAADADLHNVFVPQMTPAQLRQAIERPAAAVGLRLADGLCERMLADVGAEPGALPLLEYALDGIWQRREGRELTQAAYDAIGGAAGALAERADHVFDGLTREQQPLARRVLVRLVGSAAQGARDTRRRVPLADLRPAAPDQQPAFGIVVDTLVAERLVVRSRGLGERDHAEIELSHEALIRSWSRLGDWVTEDRDKLAEIDKVEGWARHWEGDPDALLQGAQLGYACDVRRRTVDELSPGARELIERSEAAQARREARVRRRTSWLLAAACGVVIVVGSLGLLAWRGQRRAEVAARDLVTAVVTAEAKQAEANLAAERFRDQLRMTAAREAGDDATLAVAWLREVRRPEETRRWATDAERRTRQRVSRAVLAGHTGALEDAAFSPDGDLVVTASQDDTARVWHVDSGALLATLAGHDGTVVEATFSPDGRRVLTASMDGSARVWTTDGLAQHVLGTPEADGYLHAASFSPDGRRVVTAASNGEARLWTLGEQIESTVLGGHAGAVLSASFSPDGERLVTASADGYARVWSADGSGPIRTSPPHGAMVDQAWFWPDGAHVLTRAWGKALRMWRPEDDDEPVTLLGDANGVFGSSFSADGSRVLSASADGPPMVWSWSGEDFENERPLEGHPGGVRAAAFSPDGELVVTGSNDDTARIWDATTGRQRGELSGHRGDVVAVEFDPDDKLVLTASRDGTARLWEIDRTPHPRRVAVHTRPVTAVAFSPDGRYLLTASEDGFARVLEAERLGEVAPLVGHGAAVLAAAFSPDGARVVTGSSDGTARVWRVANPGEPQVLGPHGGWITAVEFSADGHRILTVSDDDDKARVWTVGSGDDPVVLWSEGAGNLHSASFSPDGTRVVTASGDGVVRAWRADGSNRDRRPLRELSGPTADKPVEALYATYSPDGEKLVSVYSDGTVRIWDTAGAGPPRILEGHREAVLSASWSDDSALVVTASRDDTARVWDAERGGPPLQVYDTEGDVLSARFADGDSRVITVSRDFKARIWDLDGADDPFEFDCYAGFGDTAAVSPDGTRVATASPDGTVRQWAIGIESLLDLLWRATPWCPPVDLRMSTFGQMEQEAAKDLASCEDEVAKRRAGYVPMRP